MYFTRLKKCRCSRTDELHKYCLESVTSQTQYQQLHRFTGPHIHRISHLLSALTITHLQVPSPNQQDSGEYKRPSKDSDEISRDLH